MKHLFQTVFCGALLLVALVFVSGTASAHTMLRMSTNTICVCTGVCPAFF